MQGYNIDNIYPLCYDEHLYPIRQLALWQHLFEEMGYELSIEHQLSAADNEGGTEECVIYHAIKKDNPDEHFVVSYCRELKKEYDF